MADIVSPEARSRMMSGIRSKNTTPEIVLRKGLHKLGFRFRLHATELAGNPDLVFPRHRAVIFAHGCFWHGHDCHLFRLPSTKREFWLDKIERNRFVDDRTEALLAMQGWRQGVVWECALRGRARQPLDNVLRACAEWLRSDEPYLSIRGI